MTATPDPTHANHSDPFVGVVTAKDIYDATRETQSDVRAAMARVQTLENGQADQETRLRALEKWRWGIGAALALAVVSFVAGDTPLSGLIP